MRFDGFVESNVSERSNIERENNWIRLNGLTVDESYWFQVTAMDTEGNESPSEPKIFALKLRTGKYNQIMTAYSIYQKLDNYFI